MQKNKKVQRFRERGITLIALVITIIVLLILAGVALSTLTGDSGILSNAEKAKKDTDQSNLEEEVGLRVMEHRLDGGDLKTYLENIKGVGKNGVENIRDGAYKVTKGEGTVVVYEDGEIYTGEIWDGSSEVPELKGANWYIYNGKQLKFLADAVNNGGLTEEQQELVTKAGYDPDTLVTDSTMKVYLMADIELGGAGTVTKAEDGTPTSLTITKNEWTPIGNIENKFNGTFYGNDHYISGMYISAKTNAAGLFGDSNNTIKEVTVKNSYIYSEKMGIGAIVGILRNGEITDCHNVNTTMVGRGNLIGGIVGQFGGTKIEKCTNSGSVYTPVEESIKYVRRNNRDFDK